MLDVWLLCNEYCVWEDVVFNKARVYSNSDCSNVKVWQLLEFVSWAGSWAMVRRLKNVRKIIQKLKLASIITMKSHFIRGGPRERRQRIQDRRTRLDFLGCIRQMWQSSFEYNFLYLRWIVCRNRQVAINLLLSICRTFMDFIHEFEM